MERSEIDTIDAAKLGRDEERSNSTGALTVYRLDFPAQIRPRQGPKTVLIEIRKAKYPTDVIRVQRECCNDAADEKLEGREEFIEALTPDS